MLTYFTLLTTMSVAVAMNATMDSQVNAMIEDAVTSAANHNSMHGIDQDLPKTGAAKFATGMIYPPPDIRSKLATLFSQPFC